MPFGHTSATNPLNEYGEGRNDINNRETDIERRRAGVLIEERGIECWLNCNLPSIS